MKPSIFKSNRKVWPIEPDGAFLPKPSSPVRRIGHRCILVSRSQPSVEGDQHDRAPLRPQQPRDFAYGRPIVPDVLKHMRTQDQIKHSRPEGCSGEISKNVTMALNIEACVRDVRSLTQPWCDSLFRSDMEKTQIG
jgi:hypothetical protein